MTFPPAGSPPPPPAFSRPFGVILLGILNALGALLYLGLGAVLLIVSMAEPEQADGRIVLVVVGGVLVFVGAFHALTATGLFLLKEFGRVCQMIQSGLGLLAIPFGTIVSALILYYLTRPGVVLLFSGRPPAAMTPDERALVSHDSNRAVAMAIVAIVGLFGGIAMIGIVAAIAIPGLLRARMAGNEASAIGSIRAMSSAQATFASTHEGRYGTLECLTVPSSCPSADGTVSTAPFLNRSRRRARSAQRLHVPAAPVARPEPLRVLGRARSGGPVRRARVLRHRDVHGAGVPGLPVPRPVRAVGCGARAARRAAGRCNLPPCHNSPRFPPAARRSRSCRRWPSEP